MKRRFNINLKHNSYGQKEKLILQQPLMVEPITEEVMVNNEARVDTSIEVEEDHLKIDMHGINTLLK